MNLDWSKLLDDSRRRPDESSKSEHDPRDEFARDHDRILFSPAFRRLADKTQIFPHDPNDAVRNRLTHTIEVANIARGFAKRIVDGLRRDGANDSDDLLQERISSILAAAALAHDLGNPPFGHKGEKTIKAWAKRRLTRFEDGWKNDFTKFDGNAQSIRLLTRLQLRDHDYGLDLTRGTLAVALKYPTSSTGGGKKTGFFASEKNIVEDVWEAVGLGEGRRHPLTSLVEASDNIAYLAGDTEDTIRKGLASFAQLLPYLEKNEKPLFDFAKSTLEKYRSEVTAITPHELDLLTVGRFGAELISVMMNECSTTFLQRLSREDESGWETEIFDENPRLKNLMEVLRNGFHSDFAYTSHDVLERELRADSVLRDLLDVFYGAALREFGNDETAKFSATRHALTRREGTFVWSITAENYRRVFQKTPAEPPQRRAMQLAIDMVSGMTDTYALRLHAKLRSQVFSYGFRCKTESYITT